MFSNLRKLIFLGIWGVFIEAVPEGMGQDTEPPSLPDVTSKTDISLTEDNLDQLLELAEKNVAQLAQVRVGPGLTGSPSLDTPVSTVSRQETTVGKSPWAVFVITNEMIRRSGAKTIPDVLRMAPGVEVTQLDSNKWAIAIRGLNWRFSNELLVQIDGRSVYTPLFNCVFWDEHQLLLEDVERIEVIRGPGASVWGSNAVNGIINIITKRPKDTQGAYVESGTGTYQKGFAGVRYGGGNGNDFQYRVYGNWFERGDGYRPDGLAHDAWRQVRTGFRSEWQADSDNIVTLQGDYYNGYCGDQGNIPVFSFTPPYWETFFNTTRISGGNALLRWAHEIDDDRDWALQIYYDRTERHWLDYHLSEVRNTFDCDYDYRFPLGERHKFVAGFGYRNTHSDTENSFLFGMIPPQRSDYRVSYFVQDQIELQEDLWYLTLGSKFENNSWSGFEYQPTVRLLWAPDKKRAIWGSVSRAVRTPSQAEQNVYAVLTPWIPVPVYPLILGNPDAQAEDMLAWELGYRSQVTDRFSWDIAAFLYDYRDKTVLQSLPYWIPGPVPGTWFIPYQFVNLGAGKSYGFEVTNSFAATPQWKLRSSYSFLVLEFDPVVNSSSPEEFEAQTFRNEFYLSSSWDLGAHWELDMTGRYVEGIKTSVGNVPSYIVGDIRLAWRPHKNFEWSVVGRNLYDGIAHQEAINDTIFNNFSTGVRQEVYTQLIWRH
ncbi:MAG: TonB-dependent receptor [Pirellulales bacterium]|nr:TonB-dependent receptor [Pirellulales bacterium]